MDCRDRAISILMFPWLAYGHISPFLELAKRLAQRNFHIYFCSTPINLDSIKPKISPKYSKSIQLTELQLPTLSDLPPHYYTTNGLPPRLMNNLKNALDMATPNFLTLLKTLKPDLLIYDFIQPWAASLASSLKIPSILFYCSSAATACIFFHSSKNPDEKFPFAELSDLHGCMQKKMAQMIENSSNGVKDMDRFCQSFEFSSDIVLVKTSKKLEGNCLDYLQSLLNKKILPVGPLVQDSAEGEGNDEKTERFTEWLTKKEKTSTVFVSFGSEYFLSKAEREEIAEGLEQSNVNFIWVIRFPAGEETGLEEALPKGFLERVKDRGLVVEKWAPQAKILRHESIGGFVSHCGWSSVMESIKFGVPIIAVPMHLDQPINAMLVEGVGAGVEVKRNENGGIGREEMGRVIREVVLGNNGGEDVRKKVREMRDCIRDNGEEEIDRVADELVKLCLPQLDKNQD